MTFGFALFFGFAWAYGIIFICATWAEILKLKLTWTTLFISLPFIWILIIVFILLASENIKYVATCIGLVLILLSIIAGIIYRWVVKSKQ